MTILHISGDKSILILFYNNQDIEHESNDIYVGVAGLIFTPKRISKTLWDKNIHNLQNGIRICWLFFIFM